MFDAAAFSISDAEAVLMDPQQRLLLESVGEALLAGGGRILQASWAGQGRAATCKASMRGGRFPNTLPTAWSTHPVHHAALVSRLLLPCFPVQRPEACGVYVGLSFEDYGRIASEASGVDTFTATGTTASVVSGRVSYSFGLRGPALTVDTGESS